MELGGTPPLPLTENQCEKRRFFSLAELGGIPPPLNEKFAENFPQEMGKKGLK